MVRIDRTEELTKIFATTTAGQEVLLAFQRVDGNPAQRNLKFYDPGNGQTETSTFVIGCGIEHCYKLADSPAVLCSAFKDAGMKVPTVRKSHYTDRAVRKLSRLMVAVQQRLNPSTTVHPQ